jgi:tetratricopeptide (TPR) repeat protein
MNDFDKKFELDVIGRTARETNDPYALWKLAQDAVDREKYKEALGYYTTLVEVSGEEQNYYTYIMFCHIMMGKFENAFDLLEKVESPVWIEQLGVTLFESGSKYALPFFEKSLSLGCKTNLNFFAGFLGICYLAGNFVPQDLIKARKYFLMAEGDECKDDLELLERVEKFLKESPTKEMVLERALEHPDEDVPLYGYLASIGDLEGMKCVLSWHVDTPETQGHLYQVLVSKGHKEYCEILSKIHIKEGNFIKAKQVMEFIE